MKRTKLLQHLQRHGYVLKREGRSHSIWRNPQTNEIQVFRVTGKSPRILRGKYAGNCRYLNPDAIRKKQSVKSASSVVLPEILRLRSG